MTDPRDGQPHDAFGDPTSPPPPPTAPPTSPGAGPTHPPVSGADQHAAWEPGAVGEPEYIVHSGPHPTAPASFQDAPDPFAGSVGGKSLPRSDAGTQQKAGGRSWVIPVAAAVVLAVVAAAVYFLFISPDGDSDAKAGDPPTSGQADRDDGGSSAPGSSESGSAESSTGGEAQIAGTWQVQGSVESYTGPPTGQLGGTPKKVGSPAFTSPQTWTIDGCTATTCELTVQQGGMTLTLELIDGTWSGQSDQQIACSPAAGSMTDATITIAIPEDGGTAKRTLSAPCAEPIEEVDALTLTAQ